LNLSLIDTLKIPKTFSISFNTNLESKEASSELKIFFKAILEFESAKFDNWVEKTARTNKIALITENGDQYPGTPLKFIKESEKNLEYFITHLSKISILRLFITFSNEKKLNLVVQNFPDGTKEILWRITAPFDIPIQIDLDATQDSFVIKRILNLIRSFKTEVYEASFLWPVKMGKLKISASTSDEIQIFDQPIDETPNPQAQSQSLSQNTPKSWDYAAYNFLKIKEFFENNYSLTSYDNKGKDITVIVDISLKEIAENAAWLGAGYNLFLLGEGGKILNDFEKAIDVLAHEYTHAIDTFNVNLVNFGETGGIGEHVSDIMGMSAEKTISNDLNFRVGELTLSPKVKAMGYSAVRDLEFPDRSISDLPTTMNALMLLGYSKNCKPTEENDRCYAHASTGILSHALVKAIKEIGVEHFDSVVELIFATFTLRLRPDSDFQDYYIQLLNECKRQTGKLSGITSNSCSIIKNNLNLAGVTDNMNLTSDDNNEIIRDTMKKICETYRELNIPLPKYCNDIF